MAEITKEQLIDHLSKMTVMDLVTLTKALEDAWGVKAAPVVAAAGPGAGAGAAAAVVEEQTEFDVELTGIGEKKIQVIKVVRELTGLGLKEAKALVDGAPRMVKEAIPRADAEEIKKKLEDQGATVTIK